MMRFALLRGVTKVWNGAITQRGNEAFIRKFIADEASPQPLRRFAGRYPGIQETSTNMRNYLSIIDHPTDPRLRQNAYAALDAKQGFDKMADFLFSSVQVKRFITGLPGGDQILLAKTLIFLNFSLMGLDTYLYMNKKTLSQTSLEEMEDAAPLEKPSPELAEKQTAGQQQEV